MKGIFAIYKPKGPTSHDVINKLRKVTEVKKIGHAGTLDPKACGVLVVGVGREATKRLGEVVKKEKEYLATIKLGEQSTTDDSEGEKKKYEVKNIPLLKSIKQVSSHFEGEIEQIPPVYSAVKIKGRPAHRRVRKGEKVELKPRKVLITDIEVIEYDWPEIKIKVVTGPGVYIRSLARDIGKELGVGGYLADLERIRVGEFSKQEAITVQQLANKFYRD